MLASVILAALVNAGEAPSAPPPRRIERPEVRWNRLPPQRQKRLERAYRDLKARLSERDWARIRELEQANLTTGIENYPPHWQAFFVRNARWAREEIKNLPPEELTRIMDLPPAHRAEAIKKALQPRFRRHLAECRAAANQVFTRLELVILKQLPPRERVRLVRGNDPFGLISPSSWRRYQDLGARRSLVEEFVSTPDAIAAPRGRGPRPDGERHAKDERPGADARPTKDERATKGEGPAKEPSKGETAERDAPSPRPAPSAAGAKKAAD